MTAHGGAQTSRCLHEYGVQRCQRSCTSVPTLIGSARCGTTRRMPSPNALQLTRQPIRAWKGVSQANPAALERTRIDGWFPSTPSFDHNRCFSVRIFGERRPTRIYQELEREAQSALSECGSCTSGSRTARRNFAPALRLDVERPPPIILGLPTFGPHR